MDLEGIVSKRVGSRYVSGRTRLFELLNDPEHRFRSVERLSYLAGVSQSEAVDLLRNDSEVVFTKGRSGNLIARLRSR